MIHQLTSHAYAHVTTVPRIVGIGCSVPCTRVKALHIGCLQGKLGIVGGGIEHGVAVHTRQSVGQKGIYVGEILLRVDIRRKGHILVDVRVGLPVEKPTARNQRHADAQPEDCGATLNDAFTHRYAVFREL